MESSVLEVIGRVYDSASSRQEWNTTLELFADLAGGEAANMLIVSPKTGRATVLSPRSDPGFIKDFFESWAPKDPTYRTTVSAPVGKVISLADSGRDAFLKSEFYNDYWVKSGHGAERMRTNLIANPGLQVGIGLSPYARRDEISGQMHKIYHAILPHMIRSVEMQWRMHRLELERSMARATNDAGVLVVNSDSRVLIADGLAEEILSRGSPLFLENGNLSARQPSDTEALRRMVASCLPRASGYHLRGGSARISYPDSDELDIAIMPLPTEQSSFAFDVEDNAQPAALIVLEDIAARGTKMLHEMQQRYGLTHTEALVAAECLKGEPREALASKLGVTDSTVRTHLTHIYEKTGTKRRAQLVYLLFQDGFANFR